MGRRVPAEAAPVQLVGVQTESRADGELLGGRASRGAGRPRREDGWADRLGGDELVVRPSDEVLDGGVDFERVSRGTKPKKALLIISDGQDLLYTRPWVAIAPGIMISAEALFAHASRLYRVDIRRPSRA